MNENGKVHVFTGNGKGKTTAALGLAFRAIGRGLKVFMVQFLKAPETSGEHFAAESLHPMLIIKPMGKKGFIHRRGCEPLDRVLAQLALEEARSAMLEGDCQVIILDEANVAVHMNLLEVDELLEFIESKPRNIELVITGRYAHPKVAARADDVIEMKKIKHHFDQGAGAVEGIEY
jgi:cob(I)alamin adenosyltransferase